MHPFFPHLRRWSATRVCLTALFAGLAALAPAAASAQGRGDASIIVTGTATPVASREIGSSISVMDGATFAAGRHADVADRLRHVPGLAVSTSGGTGAPTQVRIRGAEGNHTLVLIDGIEVSAIGEGEFDFASLLSANIDRIEIVRGPQSGLYGSNALAGVINVITRGGDGPLLDAAVEAGSFGTVMGRSTLTLGDADNFLSASGAFRSTDGISTAAIGTETDGDRNLTGYLRGGVQIAPFARLDASLRFVDKDTQTDGFDFSGGPNQGLAVDDESFSDTREWSGGAVLTLDLGEHVEMQFDAAYTDYTSVGGAGTTGTFGNEGQRFKAGGRTTLRFDTGPALSHALTAFFDYEDESYRNTFPSDPSQFAAQNRDLLGVGLEYRLNLSDSLFLKGAVRHDENEDFSDATTFSLTGSWVVDATGSRLHASYGTGVTNPTFSEQFGFTPGLFVGNPDLLPEEAEGWDVGIEQQIGDALLVDLTYFQSTLTDEITSSFPTVINNLGESEREGVEVSARADLGWLNLSGSYTWLDASDPDGTREVRRPQHQASLDASGSFGPDERGQIAFGVIYNGEMLDNDFRNFFNLFAAEKNPVDSYVVARIAGSYRLNDTLELFGRVENLFDENYEEVISYATPGLAAYGGLRLQLR